MRAVKRVCFPTYAGSFIGADGLLRAFPFTETPTGKQHTKSVTGLSINVTKNIFYYIVGVDSASSGHCGYTHHQVSSGLDFYRHGRADVCHVSKLIFNSVINFIRKLYLAIRNKASHMKICRLTCRVVYRECTCIQFPSGDNPHEQTP